MPNILNRLKQSIDYKGIKPRTFEASIGMSNGNFMKQLRNNATIGSDKLENICKIYPDINPAWLLTGDGEMILEAKKSPNDSMFFVNEPQMPYNTSNDEKYLISVQMRLISSLEKEVEELRTKSLSALKLLMAINSRN